MNKIFAFFCVFVVSASCFSQVQKNNNKENSKPESIKLGFKFVALEKDSLIFNEILSFAEKQKLRTKPLANIVDAVGNYFLETPYVAHTLEITDKEKLIVNFRELDCTTFLETSLALSLCIKANRLSIIDFAKTLMRIRYRNGQLLDYTSRLHYFTDWIIDNQKKGIVRLISEDFGDAPFDASVNFMSTHPKSYKQLNDTTIIKKIANQETRISKSKFKYVTKENIRNVESKIADGDLIAITTKIQGLDITHVGIAKFVNERLHLLHASSKLNKVVISELPLSEYIKKSRNNTGIMVCRPILD